MCMQDIAFLENEVGFTGHAPAAAVAALGDNLESRSSSPNLMGGAAAEMSEFMKSEPSSSRV